MVLTPTVHLFFLVHPLVKSSDQPPESKYIHKTVIYHSLLMLLFSFGADSLIPGC